MKDGAYVSVNAMCGERGGRGLGLCGWGQGRGAYHAMHEPCLGGGFGGWGSLAKFGWWEGSCLGGAQVEEVTCPTLTCRNFGSLNRTYTIKGSLYPFYGAKKTIRAIPIKIR